MARIDLDDFDPIIKQVTQLQDRVPATYSSYSINGVRYLQIDTYGRNGVRKKAMGNPSQVFQFDRETLERIIELAKEAKVL